MRIMTTDSSVINSFTGYYSFLSNFYEGPYLEFRGFRFKTGEHMFNALKTLSPNQAHFVMEAETPGEAKKRGRRVTLRDNWDDVERFKAMRYTVAAKFLGTPLGQALVDHTGDSTLIEGNTWHDNVWGDCRCGRQACQAEGQNHLGKLLMELRDDLRKWTS